MNPDIADATRVSGKEDASAAEGRHQAACFQALFEQAPAGICLVSEEGCFLQVNERFCAMLGYSREELLWKNRAEVTHAEDCEKEASIMAGLLAGLPPGAPWEKRCLHKSGRVVWTNQSLSRVPGAGKPCFLFTIEDLSGKKRADAQLARSGRSLRMLRDCNEALIRAESEPVLLSAICQIAVEVGGFVMAGVGYAMDDEAKSIVPLAHAGAESSYFSAINLSWSEDRPEGRGPAGCVIRSAQPVVISDLDAEEAFRPWADAARRRGFKGIICLPLRAAAHAFGILALYLGETRSPQPEELHFLGGLADDLAFGIVTLRSRAEQRRTHDAVLTIARGLSARTGTEFFEKLTRSLVEALGAHAGYVAQFTSPDHAFARTLCVLEGGQVRPGFSHALSGSPNEALTRGETTIVARDLARLYPGAHFLTECEAYAGIELPDDAGAPIGLMFVLFKNSLIQREFVSSTLKIFASRAASELERQKADAKVREQASLLDKAQDAILVRGLDHCITYWNKSAERLYGWSAAEALGRSIKELLHNDGAILEEAMRVLLLEGDWSGELALIAKDGRRLAIEARWTLVRDEEGAPRSVLAINTDITARRKLEQQFLRAQRLESIGTLAGGIAHDLNNVLAPIMLGVGMLRTGETDAWRSQILATVEASAERGASMVKHVLSFARGVEGQRLEVKIKDVVRETVMIANDTFLKSICMRAFVPNNVWSVTGDSTQLHQVFLNLCVNARDAMPNGGSLVISAQNAAVGALEAPVDAKPGEYVCVTVEDNGAGMAPQVIEQIFDPFFTTKEPGKGTGLGLSTSLSIVKSHGGFIKVESEPGHGTKFAVFLPAHLEKSTQGGSTDQPELPRGNGELILVVDDEAAVREMTQQTLETFGYRVILAADGAEAVAACARHGQDFVAVLTDMMMPVLDGPSAIQVLMRLNPRLAFIAASGLSTSEHVEKVRNLGVNHFLSKPYSAQALLRVLHELLAGKNGEAFL